MFALSLGLCCVESLAFLEQMRNTVPAYHWLFYWKFLSVVSSFLLCGCFCLFLYVSPLDYFISAVFPAGHIILLSM
jgi:hypothetical protein